MIALRMSDAETTMTLIGFFLLFFFQKKKIIISFPHPPLNFLFYIIIIFMCIFFPFLTEAGADLFIKTHSGDSALSLSEDLMDDDVHRKVLEQYESKRTEQVHTNSYFSFPLLSLPLSLPLPLWGLTLNYLN